MCSGALRRYLQEKGQLPDKPLIAGVPISLREPGDTRQNSIAVIALVAGGP